MRRDSDAVKARAVQSVSRLCTRATLIRAGARIAPALPDRVLRLLAVAAGEAGCLLDRTRRAAVRQNLAHLVPHLPRTAHRRLVRSTFRNFALCVADLLHSAGRTPAAARALAAAPDLAILDAALARGRGAIVVSAHLGPWDLGAAILAAHGYPVYAVAERLGAGSFEAYRRLRESSGVRVIALDEQPREVVHVLARNEVLLLVADRPLSGRSLVAPFGHGYRRVPCGPAALALRSGAPLLVAHIALGPGDPAFVGGLAAVPVSSGATVESVTVDVSRTLGRLASRFPDQWFVFQPDWLPATAGGASA